MKRKEGYIDRDEVLINYSNKPIPSSTDRTCRGPDRTG
jgi:hypothetical protein